MLNCHYREQVKPDIMSQIEAGVPVEQIIRSIIEKYGTELMTAPRGSGFGLFGWTMPFVALLLGLIAAPFFIKKWRAQQAEATAATAKVDDATLAKFRSQIEKDLEELD
jgi:cytochrome c-type biogenesis protein CcmH/NrfF